MPLTVTNVSDPFKFFGLIVQLKILPDDTNPDLFR
nr:MAG TPA: hypothetical protein [Bacteriophage sp.]